MSNNKSSYDYGKCHVCAEQMKPLETPVETQDDLIDLSAKVYDGLTEEELDEVERLALDRGKFFYRPTS